MAKKFIQKAVNKMKEKGTVGSLHRALGVSENKTIPAGKVETAAHSDNPKLRKKAQFALNVRK
ncbi:MAG TPA: hypothetical protein VNS88_06870 [Nitrospiraceae bacterium]|nr:hypothetical protein [Nitrospiraceae bacterium]